MTVDSSIRVSTREGESSVAPSSASANGLANGGLDERLSTGIRPGPWLTLATLLPIAAYFSYVFAYSVNVPFVDDWSVVPLVNSALHGHLPAAGLWAQWGSDRPVTVRLVILAVGLSDHLNERMVLFIQAAVFSGTFVLIVRMLRSYTGRTVAPWWALAVGAIWFSLADAQSTLWAYSLVIYLSLFFTVLAAYLLLVARRGHLTFVLAIASAVLGSLSATEGFLAWVVGFICLVWTRERSRRTYARVLAWVSAFVVTTALFVHGYSFSNPSCNAAATHCSLGFAARHPIQLVRFFVVVVGNVVPTTLWTIPRHDFRAHEALGVGIIVVAAVVLAQAWRERRTVSNPLPVLLIVFGLLFDAMIAESRVGEGLAAAGTDHYTAPNIVILVGILVYMLAHWPDWRELWRAHTVRNRLRVVAVFGVSLFLACQFALSTRFGIESGRTIRQANNADAVVLVNMAAIPPAERPCYLQYAAFFSGAWMRGWYQLAEEDHLSVFQPATEARFRGQPVRPVARCAST